MTDTRADYDSPWKEAIELYFWEFMAFFFPAIAPHLAQHRDPEFLDTELQQIVRDADVGRRWADKLVKVWLVDGTETWLLIHIEVQSQYQAEFAQRMYVYNYRLRDRYDRPVVSLGVLADDRPRWRPSTYETSVLGCEVRFNFPVVKLLDYAEDWSALEANRNPFATVVMAHLKARETSGDALRRKDWKLRLTRRLYEQGYGREDILELYRFIDWLIDLPEPLEMVFQAELAAYEGDGTMRYVSTIERQGIQKGREEGRQEEGRSLVLRLLNRCIGELPESVIQQVDTLSIESLEALGEALLDFRSMDDLEQWFTAHHQQQSQQE
jgi:hypothetical protein